jgi:hypothetical protein
MQQTIHNPCPILLQLLLLHLTYLISNNLLSCVIPVLKFHVRYVLKQWMFTYDIYVKLMKSKKTAGSFLDSN